MAPPCGGAAAASKHVALRRTPRPCYRAWVMVDAGSTSRRTRRALVVIAAAALPTATVLAAQVFLPFRHALPDAFSPQGSSDAAAQVLANLALSLSSLAIAMLVGAAVVAREHATQSFARWRTIVLTVQVTAAVVAVYCGYRFQLSVAEQLGSYRLDLDRIADRLEAQASAVLVGASCLLCLAVDRVIPASTGGAPAAASASPMRKSRPPTGRRKPA